MAGPGEEPATFQCLLLLKNIYIFTGTGSNHIFSLLLLKS